jgi:hypothetical protein
MLGVYTTIFGVLFAHAVVLPSLSSYLGSFHASTPVLGYALAATCIGEFLMAPIFTMWCESQSPPALMRVADRSSCPLHRPFA